MGLEGVIDNIRVGLTRIMEYTVVREDCPKFLLDKGIAVLSTPRMIALMEENARRLLEEHLPTTHTSVGYHVDIYHKAPAPLGSKITVKATVIEAEGRRVKFRVEALMNDKVIGEGTHERAIVSWEKFRDKVRS